MKKHQKEAVIRTQVLEKLETQPEWFHEVQTETKPSRIVNRRTKDQAKEVRRRRRFELDD